MAKLATLTPLELYNLLQDGGRDKLVVDLRPAADFTANCIRTALSYPWDSTFSKFKHSSGGYELNGISGKKMLVVNSSESDPPTWIEKEDKSFAMRGLVYPTVVLYDNSGDDGGNALEVARFFHREGKFKNVFVLEGGFERFSSAFSFVCTSVERKIKALDGSLPTQILPNFLFLGSAENAASSTQLDALGIRYVLNMADELLPPDSVGRAGMNYLKCGSIDVPEFDISLHFAKAIEFLDSALESNSGVLVHCAMGISRSATIVILYLMHKRKMSLVEATALVKGQRSVIRPNLGFVKRLEEFDVSRAFPAVRPFFLAASSFLTSHYSYRIDELRQIHYSTRTFGRDLLLWDEFSPQKHNWLDGGGVAA